jgi:saccharopine dehydrogenase-like NADP-dependent oxidoreductase
MKTIAVLGAGMVGKAMALDLARQHQIISADLNSDNLKALRHPNIKTVQADLSKSKSIHQVISTADLVIGAVPGFMGFMTLQSVIEAKKNVVDISFFPEDPFELDALARKNNVIAVMDCGVAPGMDNILLAYHARTMDVENFICVVGGLPLLRIKPFEYKAPFSPADVIEEYTRPARIVVNGKMIIKPALSEVEEMTFDEIGTLEAFNSDGLRSLVKTMKHIPNMKEKTLRYPGHAQMMEALRSMGFFSKEEIMVRGKKVVPLDVTSALFFPKWKYQTGEDEFTVMRIVIEGKQNGKSKMIQYDLLDRYDHETKTSSMARTTGYTCTAAANLVLSGLYKKKGIHPPEHLGENEKCVQFIIQYLSDRGVIYHKIEE